jgi:hypothetical protein
MNNQDIILHHPLFLSFIHKYKNDVKQVEHVKPVDPVQPDNHFSFFFIYAGNDC